MRLTFAANCAVAAFVQFFIVLAATSAGCAASLNDNDMLNFLTQSLCLDAAGKPTTQIPIIDNCPSMRPQRADDKAIYEKRDWPDHQVYPHYFLTGHQASDSVLVTSAKRSVVEQTLDFGGDPQHHFGYFDANDAGQVVLLVGGWASIAMTQDANGGVQWFIGSGCKRSAEGGRQSWLLFNQAVPTGSWAAALAQLNITRSASDCPQRFNPAYTRYRREQIPFPFRLVQGNNVTMASRPLDVIISEHFGGAAANPASNAHLERFYFARYLGLVRWERWENRAMNNAPQLSAQARDVVASARCPAVSYSTSPGPNWVMAGCRNWTTIIKLNGTWSVKNYQWRALEAADWR